MQERTNMTNLAEYYQQKQDMKVTQLRDKDKTTALTTMDMETWIEKTRTETKDTASVRLQRSVAIFPARLTLLRSRQATEDSSGCGIPQGRRWKTNEKL